MSAQSKLTAAILAATQKKRPARVPFLTAGCPNVNRFWECLVELEENGADIIEIGVPFSDPVADGPLIAAASQKAIEDGVDLAWILEGLKKIKLKVPVVLMSYANPLAQYAWDRSEGANLSQRSLASLKVLAHDFRPYVSGVICPDVPLEESGPFHLAFDGTGIDLIVLVGPNTSSERMAKYARLAKGYVYVVSVLGTTGVRRDLSLEARASLARARAAFDLPLALGFGLSEPKQLAALNKSPDAVIFGSALMSHIINGGSVKDFMAPWLEAFPFELR
ncbi:MAG: tryptophan synthase subunit alpha [Deltaproteobacteria bacterium]|jgi:tryptophan synthase alpha chain|nr:tryptophan synthase subunit alpha [Deltaproteobacteria bacterium]